MEMGPDHPLGKACVRYLERTRSWPPRRAAWGREGVQRIGGPPWIERFYQEIMHQFFGMDPGEGGRAELPFLSMVQHVRAFGVATGRFPDSGSADRHEALMGRWLQRQGEMAARGVLGRRSWEMRPARRRGANEVDILVSQEECHADVIQQSAGRRGLTGCWS